MRKAFVIKVVWFIMGLFVFIRQIHCDIVNEWSSHQLHRQK